MSNDITKQPFQAGRNVSASTLNAMHNASLRARGVGGINVRYEPGGRMQIEALGAILPPAFGLDYWGIIDETHPVPRGWLVRDGSAVSRTTYARLYAVIGDTYGNGDGSTTFNLPNDVQRVTVGVGDAGGSVDPYDLGDSGGYNYHGAAENNHYDHIAEIDLDHVHDVPMDSQEICVGPDTGGVCDIGAATVPVFTANLDTGDPDAWGTGDGIPSAASPDANQGSISKTDNKLNVRFKHGGYSNLANNSGSFDSNTDNRQPYIACWKLIKT